MNKFASKALISPGTLRANDGLKNDLISKVCKMQWNELSENLDESALKNGVNLTMVLSESGDKPTSVLI